MMPDRPGRTDSINQMHSINMLIKRVRDIDCDPFDRYSMSSAYQSLWFRDKNLVADTM